VTRRRQRGTVPANRRVEHLGRTYRVCFHGDRKDAHVLMVMLKCSAGGERVVEPTGRLGRRLVAMARELL
jgi:hypothetical protein